MYYTCSVRSRLRRCFLPDTFRSSSQRTRRDLHCSLKSETGANREPVDGDDAAHWLAVDTCPGCTDLSMSPGGKLCLATWNARMNPWSVLPRSASDGSPGTHHESIDQATEATHLSQADRTVAEERVHGADHPSAANSDNPCGTTTNPLASASRGPHLANVGGTAERLLQRADLRGSRATRTPDASRLRLSPRTDCTRPTRSCVYALIRRKNDRPRAQPRRAHTHTPRGPARDP